MYIKRIYNIAGIVLKEYMADADLIFKLYPPYAVINVWEQFESVTMSLRDLVNYPEAYESFEFLYKQARALRWKRNGVGLTMHSLWR